MCKNDEGIVMPIFEALRAAVFPLFTKNLRGGADIRPSPRRYMYKRLVYEKRYAKISTKSVVK